MEQNNKKTLIIAGVAIIVVIALAIILPHLKKPAEAPTVTPGAETVVPGTTPTTTKKSSTSASAASAAYNATVKEYAGREIIFGADCTATPNDHIQALGTKVLLVNNSNVTHTVIVGSNSGVSIGAYHYKTVIVRDDGTNIVSCDANQKVATVTVK